MTIFSIFFCSKNARVTSLVRSQLKIINNKNICFFLVLNLKKLLREPLLIERSHIRRHSTTNDRFFNVKKFVVSLTIINIFINEKKIKNYSFFKQSYKKRVLIVSIKTIVIRFLKVQKDWVVFFSKTINNHCKQ